jgi:hypothetical protein
MALMKFDKIYFPVTGIENIRIPKSFECTRNLTRIRSMSCRHLPVNWTSCKSTRSSSRKVHRRFRG